MIEHNSEVYNHPYISFFIVHVWGGGGGGGGGGVVYLWAVGVFALVLVYIPSYTSCYIFNVLYNTLYIHN